MTTLTETLPKPAARRVGPRATLNHSLTLTWRNLVQIKHDPWELLGLSVQPIMLLLLFVYVFGGAIAGNTTDYLQFALPGIIAQNVLYSTVGTAIALNTDIAKGVFDRLRSLPIARTAPLTGRIVADSVKQLWALGLFLGIGALLGFRVQNGVGGVLGTVALLMVFTLSMSWLAVLVGLTAKNPERVQLLTFSLIMPLTFTSNAFVPSETMPGWLRTWAEVNPVSQLADAVRGMLIGGEVAAPTTNSLLWAVGVIVVFAPLAVRAFRRGR
ncbi:ABC-2 type transport system permease protein/oleandomycin transport system permease protein [Sinosporangium album]|uniref:Transport permease protein n=1 Tax=Sinosporangium album TaxID=504805 RepID=A0A1G8BDG8_9ACTN|nr:ABC transporter permease [Sinosporangium album]SDH31249.1 ABC-2 type transport system permease protein/oleandomycin transport system permease protein [Sinosporangium album]